MDRSGCYSTRALEQNMRNGDVPLPEHLETEADALSRNCTSNPPAQSQPPPTTPGAESPNHVSTDYATHESRAEVNADHINDPRHSSELIESIQTASPARPIPGAKCRTWPRLQVIPTTGDQVECPICRVQIGAYNEDKYKEFAVRTKCGHIFGSDCLFEWCQPYVQNITRRGAPPDENLPTCPMCRQQLHTDDIFADGSFCVECEQGGHSLSNKSGPLVQFENGNTGHEVLDSKKTWLCVGEHTLRRIRAGDPALLAKYATRRERVVVPEEFERCGWSSGATGIGSSL